MVAGCIKCNVICRDCFRDNGEQLINCKFLQVVFMEDNKYISVKSAKKHGNSIKVVLNQYLPYWPLFLLLLICCLGIGYLYLYMTKPVYEVTASILIKDEKKGADAERISDAINGYGLTKIVENEV